MKIGKREEIFGELGNFLASGNLDSKETAAEISENAFAPNLFKISDTAIRDQKIADYVKALQTHANPLSPHYSTCTRLLWKLKVEVGQHQTSPELSELIGKTALVFDSFVKSYNAPIVKSPEAPIDDTLSQPTLTLTSPVYGKYPDASCLVTDLGKRAKEPKSLKKFAKRIKKDIKHDPVLGKKFLAAASSDKELGKDFHARAYLDTRIDNSVNANRVRTDNLAQFILGACPRPKEISDYIYHTLLASDCSVWFTLNQIGEKGPCVKFWDNLVIENVPFADNWKMKRIGDEEVILEDGQAKLVRSRIVAEKEGTKKEISHYHYVNWKDRNPAPSDAILLECAKIACKHFQETKTPVGVNCRAGVGRTGSLALLATAMQHINDAKTSGTKTEEMVINIPELYYGLRNQRKLSVLKKHLPQLHRVLSTYVQQELTQAK